MRARTNEWSYTADVKEWINTILRTDPSLGSIFSEAKVETPTQVKATRKRRDLTLPDKAGDPEVVARPAMSTHIAIPCPSLEEDGLADTQ